MQSRFLMEAVKYNVLPIDSSFADRMDPSTRPNLLRGKTEFTYYPGMFRIPEANSPDVHNKSFTVTAEVEIPEKGADGVLATQGGRFGGWSLLILDGKPMFVYNLVDMKRVKWEGKQALSPGKHTLVFDFVYDGGGIGKGGTGTLKVDGKVAQVGKMPQTLPITFQWDETFDVGVDTGTPVADNDYQVPFRFTGRLDRLTVQLKPNPQAEQKRMMGLREKARD